MMHPVPTVICTGHRQGAQKSNLRSSIQWTNGIMLSDLDFAQDVTVLTDDSQDMSNFGDVDHEINCHIRHVLAAFKQLRKIWKNQKLTLILKVQFYRTNALSTLLYGSETWQLIPTQEKNLNNI